MNENRSEENKEGKEPGEVESTKRTNEENDEGCLLDSQLMDMWDCPVATTSGNRTAKRKTRYSASSPSWSGVHKLDEVDGRKLSIRLIAAATVTKDRATMIKASPTQTTTPKLKKTAMGTSVLTRSQRSRLLKSGGDTVASSAVASKSIKRKHESCSSSSDSSDNPVKINKKLKPCIKPYFISNGTRTRRNAAIQANSKLVSSHNDRKTSNEIVPFYDPISASSSASSSAAASYHQQQQQNQQSTSSQSCEESNGMLTAPSTPTRIAEIDGEDEWLKRFQLWNASEKIEVLERLIGVCHSSEVRHMMSVIEPYFQRDFISLLPEEVSLHILRLLEPRDLLKAAEICKCWKRLSEDNLLWRHKCVEEGINEPHRVGGGGGRRGGRQPAIATSSPWKAAYIRRMKIEHNWRSGVKKISRVLKGHDDHVITCLQFNGTRIVSGSDDNTLKVWSAVTGKCLKTLTGHTGGVWASQMRRNTIISGSTDRTLKVWNAETGECVHTLHGHTSTVRCLALHEDIVVSGSRDATLRVWDINSGECKHILTGHLAAVRCVCYDGKKVVSGAYDYLVKIWDPEKEECLHTLQGHTNRVYSLQFDGTYVVSGSLDTSIRVWDSESGACLNVLTGHQSLTSGMELKDNILVSGNADSTVKIWNILTGECLKTLEGANKHQSAVTCLQFYGKFVITSSDDGTVKLWDVKTGKVIRDVVSLESRGSGGVVWRIKASRTKLVCAVGSRYGTEETKLLVLDFDPPATT